MDGRGAFGIDFVTDWTCRDSQILPHKKLSSIILALLSMRLAETFACTEKGCCLIM